MPGADQDVRGGPAGPLGELAAWAQAEPVRGEITLVVAGATPVISTVDDADLVAEVLARQGEGAGRNDAIAAVAKRHGLARRHVYDAVLRSRP